MPRDERRHQKALMKKRSKQKAAGHHKSQQADSVTLSVPGIIRHSHTFPLLDCLISASWQKENPGLVEILLSRLQPDGDICFATYLVDKLCLGLKNTFANGGFSRTRYENEVRGRVFHGTVPVECPIELAHQMIYASIDYAAQFGFMPNKDYDLSQYLLLPRGELKEPYHLTFGKNGKPFFVAGPHDNVGRILKQLEKNPGPGKFDYFAPFDAF